MGYAETQDEIIRAQVRDRPPVGPRVVGQPAPAPVQSTPPPTAVRRPVNAVQAGSPPTARPVVVPSADSDADADLVAAVAAARRLRFAIEVEQIAGAAGLTVEQVRGRGKGRELVEVRRIVAAYLRSRGCSLPEIGRVLNRDHTSVLHLLRTPARVTGLYEELAS